MKLRNKKTGEIREFKSVDLYEGHGIKLSAESLAELNEEWEDYDEPKEYWYIAHNGTVESFEYDDDWQYMDFNWQDKLKQIGNYFETEEEAEKAAEKLKAFANLRKRGFKFKDVGLYAGGRIKIEAAVEANTDNIMSEREYVVDNLGLIFGGEE